MALITIADNIRTASVTHSGTLDSFGLTTLLMEYGKLHAAVPIRKVTLREETPAVSPPRFIYKWTAQDGRVWKQTLWPVAAPNPVVQMNFSVADYFTEGEFAAHWSLRYEVMRLMKDYGVTEITVEIL